MLMLDPLRLAMLRELALRGTIAAVAQAMGYTPSAVSQQLATLEREAGVALTTRSGRGLVLTPAGARLATHAQAVLDAIEAAQSSLSHYQEELDGSVKIAVFQSAALSLVPAAIARLAQDHPALRVSVVHAEPASALADTWARDVDLVIAEEYPHHAAPHYPGLLRSDLLRDEIRLCALGPWAGANALEDLAQAPWIMEPEGTATRHFAEQACRLAGFEPDLRYVSADLHTHATFIEQGIAVGFLPGLMWHQGRLANHAKPLDPPAWRTVFTAMRQSSALDRSVQAVKTALEDAAARIPS